MMHKERGCKYDTLTFKGRLLGVQIVLYNTSLKTSTIFHTLLVSSYFSVFPNRYTSRHANVSVKILTTNKIDKLIIT